MEKFWDKVEKTSDCWIWKGNKVKTSKNGGFYGRIFIGGRKNGKLWYAHRLSLIVHGIELIEGMEVDHLCFNTLCVRPDHLEQVSGSENRKREYAKYGNPYKPPKTCKKGHSFDIIRNNGSRGCSICIKAYDREWKRKRYAKTKTHTRQKNNQSTNK